LSPRKPATARVTGRPEPFDSPFTLSPSKRERLAQDGPVHGRTFGLRPALGIFAIALTVRLVHVWQLRASPFFSVLMGDSRGYDEWAQRIARGDWIGSEVFYQAPLYPYFLGVIYATAGRHLLLVRIIQAAIGSASCALLGLAAARLFSRPIGRAQRRPELVDGRRAGITAGIMLALYAPAVFFDGLLQKSVLDVFFVCLALLLIARITTDTAERAERSWFDKLTMSARPEPVEGRAPRLNASASPRGMLCGEGVLTLDQVRVGSQRLIDLVCVGLAREVLHGVERGAAWD